MILVTIEETSFIPLTWKVRILNNHIDDSYLYHEDLSQAFDQIVQNKWTWDKQIHRLSR